MIFNRILAVLIVFAPIPIFAGSNVTPIETPRTRISDAEIVLLTSFLGQSEFLIEHSDDPNKQIIYDMAFSLIKQSPAGGSLRALIYEKAYALWERIGRPSDTLLFFSLIEANLGVLNRPSAIRVLFEKQRLGELMVLKNLGELNEAQGARLDELFQRKITSAQAGGPLLKKARLPDGDNLDSVSALGDFVFAVETLSLLPPTEEIRDALMQKLAASINFSRRASRNILSRKYGRISFAQMAYHELMKVLIQRFNFPANAAQSRLFNAALEANQGMEILQDIGFTREANCEKILFTQAGR